MRANEAYLRAATEAVWPPLLVNDTIMTGPPQTLATAGGVQSGTIALDPRPDPR